jgi:hypothetical protein
MRSPRIVTFALALISLSAALASDPPKKKAEPPPAAPEGETKKEEPPKRKLGLRLTEVDPVQLALRPYRVTLWLSFQPADRFSTEFRDTLKARIQVIVDRHLGAAWKLTITEPPAGMIPGDEVTPAQLEELEKTSDKLLWVGVGGSREEWNPALPECPLRVREYDFDWKEWGHALRRTVVTGPSFADQIFEGMHRQFRVRGEVGATDKDGRFDVYFMGMSLQPRDSLYPLAQVGQPLKCMREFVGRSKDGKEFFQRSPIAWTYLVYKSSSASGVASRCDVESATNSHVQGRSRKRMKILTLATGNGGNTPTMVEFVNGANRAPVTGMEVALRPQGVKALLPIGNTDHRGQILIEQPGGAEVGGNALVETTDQPRLVRALLMSGPNILASLPLIPGERPRMRAQVKIDTLQSEVGGKIAVVQNEMIDIVARRAVTKKLIEAAIKAKPPDPVLLKKYNDEFNAYPKSQHWRDKIDAIKAAAVAEAKKAGKKDISPAIHKLFLLPMVLINQFFKDETSSVNFSTKEVTAEGNEVPADGSAPAGGNSTQPPAAPEKKAE